MPTGTQGFRSGSVQIQVSPAACLWTVEGYRSTPQHSNSTRKCPEPGLNPGKVIYLRQIFGVHLWSVAVRCLSSCLWQESCSIQYVAYNQYSMLYWYNDSVVLANKCSVMVHLLLSHRTISAQILWPRAGTASPLKQKRQKLIYTVLDHGSEDTLGKWGHFSHFKGLLED